MKIQIEGLCGQEFASLDAVVPSSQEPSRFAVIDSARVFRKIAFLGEGIQAGKQCQPFIGDQGHHVAFSFNRPELERQATWQGMIGGGSSTSWEAAGYRLTLWSTHAASV